LVGCEVLQGVAAAARATMPAATRGPESFNRPPGADTVATTVPKVRSGPPLASYRASGGHELVGGCGESAAIFPEETGP
jgi:hypothetical protein